MKVLYVSQHADMVGGGEHSLLDLMANLPEEYEITLITPGQGSFTGKAERYGISVSSLPMPKLGLHSLAAIKPWLDALREMKPDIIHANNSRAAFYAAFAGRWLGIPAIFHCRIAEKDGLMDRILMRLVQAVICNSQAVAKRFSEADQPVHVIYNGIEIKQQLSVRNPLPEAERLLLFVGRISEEKQVDVALHVFGRLAEDDESLHLAIVGGDAPQGYEYADGLRAWSQQQSWGYRVHWLGQQQDISDWYSSADVLILTSKHEGFGRVLVEAMGHGLPVVAFAVGGVPEVVEDGEQGILIEPNNVGAMVQACQHIFLDEATAKRMAVSGRQRAACFSIQQHVDQICDVYKKLTPGNAYE